jgi:selenocysteine lyase/cysteine desulfurase
MIRQNVVGSRCLISTPFTATTNDKHRRNKKKQIEMVYADYTASGRCLQFIEDYMLQVVAPMYANTHTEASLTGAQTTNLREEAREIIREALNAPKDRYAVFFTGTGSTGAIDKVFRQLGFGIPEYADVKYKISETCIADDTTRPVVFISHMEHHSNELIWKESIARVIVIPEDLQTGQPNLHYLEQMLIKYKKDNVPMVGSFSAGSNVTGICTPTHTIAKLLHKYDALAFFDYAGIGAYVDINMYGKDDNDDAEEDGSFMDAVFLSPHKFIGGPGSAGVLVARRDLFEGPFDVKTTKPSLPGGGTVAYVSGYGCDYVQDCEVREDAGTPGIPQCIRTGLAFKVKAMVGSHNIEMAEAKHCAMALKAWDVHPNISLFGSDRVSYFDIEQRVSIISFNIVSPVMASRSSKKYVSKTLRYVLPLKCLELTKEQRNKSKQTNFDKNIQSSTINIVNHDDDDDNVSSNSGEVPKSLLTSDEDSDDQEHGDSDNSTNQNDIDKTDITTSTARTDSTCTLQVQPSHKKQETRRSTRPSLLLHLKAQDHSLEPTVPLPLHCNFVITLLNDLYGIQGRAGCSCAGPYGHRLYGIDGDDGRPLSNRVRFLIGKGYEAFKPGWARVNFNYFISDAEATFIVKAVNQIATYGWKLLPLYVQDMNSGLYFHRTNQNEVPFSLFDMSIQHVTNSKKNSTSEIQFDIPEMVSSSNPKTGGGIRERSPSSYNKVLQHAMATYSKATSEMISLGEDSKNTDDFTNDFPDGAHESDVWWLRPSEARKELLRLETKGQ